jgi:hypothetical protein
MSNQSSSRTHLDAIGTALLTGLAFFLPFEARRPVLPLGFVQITGVELLLYLVLAAWGIGWVAGVWRSWSTCHSGVMIWAVVIVLSASFAPFERAAAFKFALRSLGGCALFFAAADFSTSLRRVRQFVIALAAGASISALAGCAEIAWPPAARLLGVFKTQPSMVGGFLRASGTFQYANIAAMYWEAAAPLCLVLALGYGSRGRRPRLMWLFLSALFVVVEAIMLSMSRASIFLAIGVLIICLVLARSVAGIRRASVLVCLFAAVAPLVCHLLLSDSFRLRLRAPQQSSWYRADYSGAVNSLTLRPGQTVLLPVKIRNLGAMMWSSEGTHPIALSYHWGDPRSGGFVVWDGVRTRLPLEVPPGSELGLNAHIRAPGVIGRYVLHLDMVQEGATWFSLQGSPALRIPAEVRTPVSQDAEEDLTLDLFRPVLVRLVARSELWRAASRMWKDYPLLGVGPDNFRLIYGPYLGLKEFDKRIHSNSLYLETLANLGTLGMFALAAVFLPLAATFWRHMRGPACTEVKLLTLGLGASIASFYLHGFVDYFLEFTPTYALFWLVLGMTAGLARSKTSS